MERGVGQNLKKMEQAIQGGLHKIGGAKNPPPTMVHKKLFCKNDALVVQKKSLKRLVKEFIFSKISGQKPAALQKIRSITVIFEEFFLKFPEHIFYRIDLSGCFFKLYSQHCLTEVLPDFDIPLDLLLLRQTMKVW